MSSALIEFMDWVDVFFNVENTLWAHEKAIEEGDREGSKDSRRFEAKKGKEK